MYTALSEDFFDREYGRNCQTVLTQLKIGLKTSRLLRSSKLADSRWALSERSSKHMVVLKASLVIFLDPTVD